MMSATIDATAVTVPDQCLVQFAKGWLVQVHPIDMGLEPIELGHAPVTLGRSRDCVVMIHDESISRRHAVLHPTVDGYEISDLGSTNGVLVNESLVTRQVLRNGDRVQLGTRVFQFMDDEYFAARYHDTVYAMMTRDGLSGAYSGRYLMESLEREVARCQRYDRPISLVILEVDHFKAIAEKFGSVAADEVLKVLVKRLGTVLRADEILARIGDGKFAIIMVETIGKIADTVAERCRVAVQSESFITRTGLIEITISLGVASPEPMELLSPAELLDAANQRLRQATHDGCNRVISRSDIDLSARALDLITGNET